MSGERALREAIVAAGRTLKSRGLTSGRSGNLSARFDGGFLITPSGVPYESLSAPDVVHVAADGSQAPGQLAPSSEWQLHLEIYRARADAQAIAHAHPRYSTALACGRREIPAFHYMVAIAGGRSIRCAQYATYGTRELALNAVEALRDRRACLLANHGSIALGDSIETALDLLDEVEVLATQYCESLRLGQVVILSDPEMARILERFKSYGQPGNSKL
ncbi:MAG: class II aldolase/adducin family protein [Candidatus Eiseniibacteriota bacterium]